MDAAEWLTSQEMRALLAFVRDTASERKLRLFAYACCRSIWHLPTHPPNCYAVEVAEDFADGERAEGQLRAANEACYNVYANTCSPGSGFLWRCNRGR
jgi:hypothetical protein